MGTFRFVQFEFGFLLGPSDGRFLIRPETEAPPQHILVLKTLGALERRRFKGRRGTVVTDAEPEPVPTSRATVIAPADVSQAEAAAWLTDARGSNESANAEVEDALKVLNHSLQAHRISRGDAAARDVSADLALITRIGYGSGDEVADGQYEEAWELPRRGVRFAKRSMEAPDERFAALIGGREQLFACEELVMRARTDLNAGRTREAALQARIALETLLAELGDDLPGGRGRALTADRELAGAAANEALRGDLRPEVADSLAEFVERMESALRARRLASSL
jgi:hypothetical protein